MNLQKLFELQRQLDERIIREKGLERKNLLPNKILALQVELGELANEWRGFKFWSRDQEPRIESKVVCHACKGQGGFVYTDEYQQATEPFEECLYCEGTGFQEDKNPLLEEFVDCLHFILSIGLELNFAFIKDIEPIKNKNITEQFIFIFTKVGILLTYQGLAHYIHIIQNFIGLGQMLGFSWDEVEKAYLRKNAINHQRQESGY